MRWLIWHPESDCYMEVFSKEERDKLLETPECADVTDDWEHEMNFVFQRIDDEQRAQ